MAPSLLDMGVGGGICGLHGPPANIRTTDRHGSTWGASLRQQHPDRVHNDSSFSLLQDYCTLMDGGCRCFLRLMFVNHRLIAVFGPSSLNRIRIGPACGPRPHGLLA